MSTIKDEAPSSQANCSLEGFSDSKCTFPIPVYRGRHEVAYSGLTLSKVLAVEFVTDESVPMQLVAELRLGTYMRGSSISITPTAVLTIHDRADSVDVTSHDSHDTGVSIPHGVSIALEEEQPTDIEHVLVQDDPRQWSKRRKIFALATISSVTLSATLGSNIYSPMFLAAIDDIKTELYASDQQISQTLSAYILIQGSAPLFWSAVSEIRDRKVTLSLFPSHSALLDFSDLFQKIYMSLVNGNRCGHLLRRASSRPIPRSSDWWCCNATILLARDILLPVYIRWERSLSCQSALRRMTKERAEKLHVKAQNLHKGEYYEKKRHLEAQPRPILDEIKLSIKEISPIRPLIAVLRKKNNLAILFASSSLYSFAYCITYTAVRTLAVQPYYNSLEVGLVLLSFGIGSTPKYQTDDASSPALLDCIWIYSNTLAYIVDANVGRSSIAVACNSLRGVGGFITEIAVPLQDGLGDGGLYALWAGIIVVMNVLVLLTLYKEGAWRDAVEEREKNQREKT
ncbi:MFS general substrate transporter [Hysterangium stoloniferum]|nr:MFS general substrate transporter [Hysterangium stoloniferum]